MIVVITTGGNLMLQTAEWGSHLDTCFLMTIYTYRHSLHCLSQHKQPITGTQKAQEQALEDILLLVILGHAFLMHIRQVSRTPDR